MTKYGDMSGKDGRKNPTKRTVEEKVALVLQAEKFATVKEAAESLGVIPTMLQRWTRAHKEGSLKVGDDQVKRQRYQHEDKIKMLQLAKNFPSTAAAAKELGVSEGNLRRWKRETPPSALVTHRKRAPNSRKPALAATGEDAELELALLRGIAQLAVRRGLFALNLVGGKSTKED